MAQCRVPAPSCLFLLLTAQLATSLLSPAYANENDQEHRFHLIRDSQQDAELKLDGTHATGASSDQQHDDTHQGSGHVAQGATDDMQSAVPELPWGQADTALAVALKGLRQLADMGPLVQQVDEAAFASAAELADAVAVVASLQRSGARLLSQLRSQAVGESTAAGVAPLLQQLTGDAEQLARVRAALVVAQAAQRAAQASAMRSVARGALRGAQLLAEQALGAAERAAHAAAAATDLSRQAASLQQVVLAASAAAQLQASAAEKAAAHTPLPSDTSSATSSSRGSCGAESSFGAVAASLSNTRQGLATGQVTVADAWGSIGAAVNQLSRLEDPAM